MWVPSWVLWLLAAVLAVPCVYAAVCVLALMVALGKDAEVNAQKRTREALEVLACPDCWPTLPAKCAAHRWHTTPPPDAIAASTPPPARSR